MVVERSDFIQHQYTEEAINSRQSDILPTQRERKRERAKRQANNPPQAVWEILERQTRLQVLRSAGMTSEEYDSERREVNGLIEDLYKTETQTSHNKLIFEPLGDIITKPRHSFPSAFILRELSPKEYKQFRSQAKPQQESAIGRAIERASTENRILDQEEAINHFGESLLEVRKRAKLSQRVLAERVGIAESYISKLETGAFPPPSRDVTVKLADELGISDKADRLVFLLAANVASLEDVKGFRLVPESHSPPHT